MNLGINRHIAFDSKMAKYQKINWSITNSNYAI